MKKEFCLEIINSLRDCSDEEICKRAERLTPMERTVLNHLFKVKDMNMADIAARYGYSEERIHQIRDKGIRKLSKPSLPDVHDDKHLTIDDPIIALRLSTRTYNALTRRNFKTIKDIINTPESEFKKIRHMGVKSYNELRSRMKEIGFEMRDIYG